MTKIEIKTDEIENYDEVFDSIENLTKDKRKRSYKSEINKKIEDYKKKETIIFNKIDDRRSKLFGKTIHFIGQWRYDKSFGNDSNKYYRLIPCAFLILNGNKIEFDTFDMSVKDTSYLV